MAEAAHVRGQLAEVDADFGSLAPTRAEVEAAEAEVAALGAVPVAEAEAEHQRAAHELEQVQSRAAAIADELDAARARRCAGRDGASGGRTAGPDRRGR